MFFANPPTMQDLVKFALFLVFASNAVAKKRTAVTWRQVATAGRAELGVDKLPEWDGRTVLGQDGDAGCAMFDTNVAGARAHLCLRSYADYL